MHALLTRVQVRGRTFCGNARAPKLMRLRELGHRSTNGRCDSSTETTIRSINSGSLLILPSCLRYSAEPSVMPAHGGACTRYLRYQVVVLMSRLSSNVPNLTEDPSTVDNRPLDGRCR